VVAGDYSVEAQVGEVPAAGGERRDGGGGEVEEEEDHLLHYRRS